MQSSFEKMDSSKTITAFKQSAKWGLAIIALVILAFFTSSVHAMALCMLRAPVDWVINASYPSSLPSAPQAPSSPQCSSREFRQGHDLKVEVCRGDESSVVSFYLKNAPLRSFSTKDSARFVDWLRRCTGPEHGQACPLFNVNQPDCPDYTPFTLEDYICHHKDSLNLVINGFRLMKKESIDVISFLLHDK